jgi:hypothetical protein
VRPAGPQRGVLEPLSQHHPVRKAGERVMQRAVPELLRRGLSVLPRLRVEQVRRGHVGQGLRGLHVVGVEVARRIAIEVQGTEPASAVAQREREHRGEA